MFIANQRTGSQVECAAIDSINRDKVQHVVCSSKRPGVNRVIAFLHKVLLNVSADAQEGVKHSTSNNDVAEDLARYCGNANPGMNGSWRFQPTSAYEEQTYQKVTARNVHVLHAICPTGKQRQGKEHVQPRLTFWHSKLKTGMTP